MGRLGLEPRMHECDGVTARCDTDSAHRPLERRVKVTILPCLSADLGFRNQCNASLPTRHIVGLIGIEPTSFAFSERRSDLISYSP